MRIYLDESKRLGEGKMVLGGFVTYHAHGYIEKYMHLKKLEYGIKGDLEIKGTKLGGKYFYKNMVSDRSFSLLSDNILFIDIHSYSKDSLENYIRTLCSLLRKYYNFIKDYKNDIYIIADFLRLGKKTDHVIRYIEYSLNQKIDVQKKIRFTFQSSKNNLGIQLSDLIVYKLGKAYFFGEYLDEYIQKESINMNK